MWHSRCPAPSSRCNRDLCCHLHPPPPPPIPRSGHRGDSNSSVWGRREPPGGKSRERWLINLTKPAESERRKRRMEKIWMDESGNGINGTLIPFLQGKMAIWGGKIPTNPIKFHSLSRCPTPISGRRWWLKRYENINCLAFKEAEKTSSVQVHTNRWINTQQFELIIGYLYFSSALTHQPMISKCTRVNNVPEPYQTLTRLHVRKSTLLKYI